MPQATPGYTSRVLDQEIDAIAIVPLHPAYMIVGTYNLRKTESSTDDQRGNDTPAFRCGSLQIIPFKAESASTHTDEPVDLDRKDFPFAIVDIHFHPTFKTLLGAATSTGEIRFFNILRDYNDDRTYSKFRIEELGVFPFYPTSDKELPLITQFAWIPSSQEGVVFPEPRKYQVTLTACNSFGTSHFLSLNTLDDIRSRASSDPDEHGKVQCPDLSLDDHNMCIPVHKQNFDLEAWSISNLLYTNTTTPDTKQMVIISGGDDNALVASACHQQDEGWTLPTPSFTNKKTHQAGVVCILPLSEIKSIGKDLDTIPVLTGSYDEHIRLFLFDKKTSKFELETEFRIDGAGIWKIVPLDTYVVGKRLHYVLLVCGMYAGARIVRLSVSESGKRGWEWKVEAEFREGHRSMVYAAVAKKMGGKWSVVTTSFYDKVICGWEWVDEMKGRD